MQAMFWIFAITASKISVDSLFCNHLCRESSLLQNQALSQTIWGRAPATPCRKSTSTVSSTLWQDSGEHMVLTALSKNFVVEAAVDHLILSCTKGITCPWLGFSCVIFNTQWQNHCLLRMWIPFIYQKQTLPRCAWNQIRINCIEIPLKSKISTKTFLWSTFKTSKAIPVFNP